MLYVELVPRELDTFVKEARIICKRFPQVSGINVPDVLRLHTRSFEAARHLLQEGIDVIPHIRCIDAPLSQTLACIDELVRAGLKNVLIITGDLPPNPLQAIFEVTPMAVISALRKQYPRLGIYAALDPYRQSFQKEFHYAQEKLDAGATGFFTQPIFDPHLGQIYLDQLAKTQLFIGISPVITEQSKNYWITRNKAFFPQDFTLSLDNACQFARTLIRNVETRKQHAYLMPIKVPTLAYLEGIFSR